MYIYQPYIPGTAGMNREQKNRQRKRRHWFKEKHLQVALDVYQEKCSHNIIKPEDITRLAEAITKRFQNPAGLILNVYPGKQNPGYGNTKKPDQQHHIQDVTTTYTLEWGKDGKPAVTYISRDRQTSYPAELIRPPVGMTNEQTQKALGRQVIIPEPVPEGTFY